MTNRKRIQRSRKAPISDAAIKAFREWRKLEDQCQCDNGRDCAACKRRGELHSTIVNELKLKPWQYCWETDPYVMGLLARAARIDANEEVPT
jgi:hypothetical protein